MLRKRFFKTKDECEVTFELERPGAGRVELVCSANDWEPVQLRKVKAGLFRATLRLPIDSRVEFRYRIDGQEWIDDPAADDRVANRFGTTNSIADTARPAE